MAAVRDGVQHPQSRPQNRNDIDVSCDAATFGFFDGGFHDRALGRQITESFCHRQHTDALGDAAELFGLCSDVAQLHERVVNERMRDDVH